MITTALQNEDFGAGRRDAQPGWFHPVPIGRRVVAGQWLVSAAGSTVKPAGVAVLGGTAAIGEAQ